MVVDARDTSTSEPADPVLRAAVERLVAEFKPLRIILFGSRARGEASSGSDYDLLVLVEGEPDVLLLSGKMSVALRELPASFDLLVRPLQWWRKWCETPLTIEHRIESEGKALYAA
jgi:uncharacterized protein